MKYQVEKIGIELTALTVTEVLQYIEYRTSRIYTIQYCMTQDLVCG